MHSRVNRGVICILAVIALVLAGCGVATIPDEEVIGLAGSITAGTGPDTLTLYIFTAGGDLPQGENQSGYLDLLVATLDYRYSVDYYQNDALVADPDSDPWDEVIIDGSATLDAYPADFTAHYELDVSCDAMEFNEEPNDERILLNGNGLLSGSADWTNPENDTMASYTFDLDKTWTDVYMDDPSDLTWTGFPTSGTVLLIGSIGRSAEEPSGPRAGSWEGTILITFDGDEIVPVSVDGREYLWNLSTGEVTSGT